MTNTPAGWTMNTDDYCNYFNMILTYSATDEIAISIGGQIFSGEYSSEYRHYPDAI